MLDTFSKKIGNVFLIDQESFGIIAFNTSITVMHALSDGIQNSSVMSVSLMPSDDRFRGAGFDYPINSNHILLRSNPQALIPSECNVAKVANINQMFAVTDMDANLVTPEWIAKKQLAKSRLLAIWLLEQKIERYITRAKFFTGDEYLVPFMQEEFKKCDFDNGVYSDAIIEWASIAGMTPGEAYHVLSNRVASSNLIVSRLHALWFKYVNKINLLNNSEELLDLVRSNLESELRSGIV
jgi:hypothetical protein